MSLNPDVKKAQIRRCIERLLAKDRNPENLQRVFLWLRTRSFGHATVKEIGDGIAHFDQRNQGLAFSRVADFFDVADYVFRGLMLGKIDGLRPPNADGLSRAVEASIRHSDPAHVKKRLGFGFNTAKQAARAAVAKVTAGDPLASFTREERAAIELFVGQLTVGPAFTQDDIDSDLRACLRKNSLLMDGEDDALSDVVSYLCAYMITMMHQVELPLAGGKVARLYACLECPEDGGTLAITGITPTLDDHGPSSCFTVFRTNCGPEWCSEEIRSLPQTGGSWIPDIEMDARGIIHFVN